MCNLGVPACLFSSQNQQRLVVAFKLADPNGVRPDDLSRCIGWIVAVSEQDDFRRVPDRLGKRYEVGVSGNNREAVLSSIIPDSAIERAAV